MASGAWCPASMQTLPVFRPCDATVAQVAPGVSRSRVLAAQAIFSSSPQLSTAGMGSLHSAQHLQNVMKLVNDEHLKQP